MSHMSYCQILINPHKTWALDWDFDNGQTTHTMKNPVSILRLVTSCIMFVIGHMARVVSAAMLIAISVS